MILLGRGVLATNIWYLAAHGLTFRSFSRHSLALQTARALYWSKFHPEATVSDEVKHAVERWIANIGERFAKIRAVDFHLPSGFADSSLRFDDLA